MTTTLYTRALRNATEARARPGQYLEAMCTLMRVHSTLLGRSSSTAAQQSIHWWLRRQEAVETIKALDE